MTTVRPKLAVMVNKYELSGNGAGQRSEEDEDYGRVDFDNFFDGDDRGNYLESGSNSSYLLYWWHKFDVEGFVQLKSCTLDKFHRVNLTDFQLASSEHQSQSPSRGVGRKEEMKKLNDDGNNG